MAAITIDELRNMLEARTGRTQTHAGGAGFSARCPGPRHKRGDRSASLSVDPGEKGITLQCFTGCTFEEICAALGIEQSALFYGRVGGGVDTPTRTTATLQHPPTKTESNGGEVLQGAVQPSATLQQSADVPRQGCKLIDYAGKKRIPPAFLRMQGLSEIVYDRAPAVRIPYRDTAGIDRSVRFRIELDKTPEGDNRFKWKSGSKTMLYGLWRLSSERGRQSAITLVEGESDCHTLWFNGIPALGIPGAKTWNEERDAPHFEGFSTIYIVVEPDTGGVAVKEWLAKSRIRDRVRLVSLGEQKDASGLFLSVDGDKDRFAAAWQKALDASVAWTEQEATERKHEADTAWKACGELARKPDILAAFSDAIVADGVVGEERTVKLIYLAVTSRLLESVVSLILKGPSSAGKSYTTERVLRYFPDAAYYALSAMSERSLAYSDEPVSHRMMVFYEAAGIRGDFATYLLRTLLSEGCIRYDTVEKTPEGMRPRQIVRPGPAGALITTTEVSLHAENETRMLSVPVTDTKDQTKRILKAQAREDRKEPDRTTWLALQAWLATAERRVTIPFAVQLAEAIPPLAVRLRRDFPQVLNLIRAHAVLHQATRQNDEQGRIIATHADYAAVRGLVYDLISDGVEATIPATVRETVAAVGVIAPNGASATIAQVAEKLNLDKSAATRRVQTAIKRGYLKNLEDRKGHPAQIVLSSEKMPDDIEVLPTVAVLQDPCTKQCNTSVPDISAVDGDHCSSADVDEGIPPLPPTHANGHTNGHVRADVLGAAEALGWGYVQVSQAVRLGGTEDRWRTFAANHSAEEVRRALDLLKSTLQAKG